MSIEKITLEQAIAYISSGYCGGKESEFLDGEHIFKNDCQQYVNNWWVPTAMVVEKFKAVIGDKWSMKASSDLARTAIIFDGQYIIARGGLCPGGVRLFEVVDIEDMKKFKKRFEK